MGVITRPVTKFYKLLEALNLELDFAHFCCRWLRYRWGLYSLRAARDFADTLGVRLGLVAEVGVAPILNWTAIHAVGTRRSLRIWITPRGENLVVEPVVYTRRPSRRNLSAFTARRTPTYDELHEKVISITRNTSSYK